MAIRYESNVGNTAIARGIIRGKLCVFDMPKIAAANDISIEQWVHHKEILSTLFNRNQKAELVRCYIYDLVEPYELTSYIIDRKNMRLFESL